MICSKDPENIDIKLYDDALKKVPKFKYLIYLLTAIGLSPGGSSTVHIYTKKKCTERYKTNNK